MALTNREMDIMRIAWQRGEVTVRAVYEEIRSKERVAYTTIMTMMKILERKGRLRKHLHGRAFVYEPVDSKDEAVEEVLWELVDRLFDGSVDSLVELLNRTRYFTEVGSAIRRKAQLRRLPGKSS